jgi:hypothetical protein
MNLIDLKQSLTLPAKALNQLPPHIAAFSALLVPEYSQVMGLMLSEINEEEQARNYGFVACLGFTLALPGRAAGLGEKFHVEAAQLAGRTFFSPSRAARFEIDGIALLGVAIGLMALNTPKDETKWLLDLLETSEQTLKDDDWEKSLVLAARVVLTGEDWSLVPDVLIKVAIPFALKMPPDTLQRQEAWEVASILDETDDPVRISVKRAVFDCCASSLATLPINGANLSELIALLENISKSMSHWTFETKPRVKNVPFSKWNIDHEYHVQNLLWTILRPIFPDLVDEESLPKIGHIASRFDLGIPSLQTIIEVKFMRKSGQAACKKITEELAADSALYLNPETKYVRIVAFIWDECCQTEEYEVLKLGLESLKGVERVVILPRPNRMKRC